MADPKHPVTLTPKQAAALLAVRAMVVQDEVAFALGDNTAACERGPGTPTRGPGSPRLRLAQLAVQQVHQKTVRRPSCHVPSRPRS